jgi:hypothetical protein
MHRIDTDGHVGNMFDSGDPAVPRLPTLIDKHWLNAVQEELRSAIVGAGLTLVKGTNNQLASIMANLTTAQTFTALKTFAARLVATAAPGLGAAVATIKGTGSGGGDNGGGGSITHGGRGVEGIGGDTQDHQGGTGGYFEGGDGADGGHGVESTGGSGDLSTGYGGRFTGGAGGGGRDGGHGVRAKGGAGGGGGIGGVGLECEGGHDGSAYWKAIHATHGDVHVDDGNLIVDGLASTIGVQAIQAPTLINSWLNFGAPARNAGYWKDPFGMVHIHGTVKTGVDSSVVFQLPVGYRPSGNMRFPTGGTGNANAAILIDSSGNVSYTLDGTGVTVITNAALDGISFRAA